MSAVTLLRGASQPNAARSTATDAPARSRHPQLRIADDQMVHWHRTAGGVVPALPQDVPVPRFGDVLYLAPTSAWGVALVTYEWMVDGTVQLEVWLEFIGAARVCAGAVGNTRH